MKSEAQAHDLVPADDGQMSESEESEENSIADGQVGQEHGEKKKTKKRKRNSISKFWGYVRWGGGRDDT